MKLICPNCETTWDDTSKLINIGSSCPGCNKAVLVKFQPSPEKFIKESIQIGNFTLDNLPDGDFLLFRQNDEGMHIKRYKMIEVIQKFFDEHF